MSISDTQSAKKYASIAQVAAAQAKVYALELETAPDYAAQAQASAEQAENASDSASQFSTNASNAAAASAASAESAAESAQEAASQVGIGIAQAVRAPTGESLTALPAAASRINSYIATGAAGDIEIVSRDSVPLLGSDGKLPVSVIPSIALTEPFVVTSQAAMLALNAQPGDIAKRTDLGYSFCLAASPASTLSNWVQLTDDVLAQLGLSSGAAQVGATSLSGASSTVQDELNKKPDSANLSASTGAASIGALNAAGGAATLQSVLNEKAPLASPSLAGIPTAPTAAAGTNTTQLATMAALYAATQGFGLGSTSIPAVTNLDTITQTGIYRYSSTATTNPLAGAGGTIIHSAYSSTNASQIAISLSGTSTTLNARTFTRVMKTDGTWTAWQELATLASPTLTGTPTAPTAAAGTNTTQLATMAAVYAATLGFGLGATAVPQVTDLNSAVRGGLYAFGTTASNLPLTGASGMVYVNSYSTNYVAQIVVTVQTSTASLYNRTFTRTYNNGTWGAWVELANAGANSNITSLSGLTTPLSIAQGGSGNTTGVYNFAATTNFWLDVHPAARIFRINDRIFNGAAANNDGNITSTPSTTTKDWLELTRGSTTNNAQMAVLSTIGQGAIIGGSRSSDSGTSGSMGCIGLQGWALNDNITNVQTVYGAYLEVRRSVGAGNTHGFELDVVNFGSQVSVQPYDMFQDGLSVGGWFASGGEFTTTRASAAIAIINNGSTWEKGIVFHSTSLDGSDGITGNGIAMEMAKGHVIRWMFGSGSQGATISSSISNSAAEQDLLFTDTGTILRNSASIAMFQVSISNSFINGLLVTPGVTGTGVLISPQGSDANIDLMLAAKGTGLIRINSPTVSSTAGAQAGFLSIKLGSATYKIPYYAVS